MSCQLGTFVFDGERGTLQQPKAVVEHYTRFGSNEVYIQKIKTESKESEIEIWHVYDSYINVNSALTYIKNLVGTKTTFKDSHNQNHNNVYLVDFTHEISKKADDKWLIKLKVTLIRDERA